MNLGFEFWSLAFIAVVHDFSISVGVVLPLTALYDIIVSRQCTTEEHKRLLLFMI